MAKIVGNGLPAQGAGAQPKVDLSQAKDLNCIHCNNQYFIQAVMVKKISRFVTGTTNDAVLPIDVLLCGNCGQPLEDLLPKEFRKNTTPERKEDATPPKTDNGTTAGGIILEP